MRHECKITVLETKCFRLSGILWIFTNKTILSITTTIVSSNQFSLSIEIYMTAKQT